MTQLLLLNEQLSNKIGKLYLTYQTWLHLGLVLALLSLVAFAKGSLDALTSYEALFLNDVCPPPAR